MAKQQLWKRISAIVLAAVVAIPAGIMNPNVAKAAESIIANGDFDNDAAVDTSGWSIGESTLEEVVETATAISDDFSSGTADGWSTSKGTISVADGVMSVSTANTARNVESTAVVVPEGATMNVSIKVDATSAAKVSVYLMEYSDNKSTENKIELTSTTSADGTWGEYSGTITRATGYTQVAFKISAPRQYRTAMTIDDALITYTATTGEYVYGDGIVMDGSDYAMKLSDGNSTTYSASLTAGEWYEYTYDVHTENAGSDFVYGLKLGDEIKTATSGLFQATEGMTIGFGTNGTGTAYFDDLAVTAHVHNFVEGVADETTIATEATCTEKATYYKVCDACGTKGTDTFASGSANGHDVSSVDAVASTCTSEGNIEYWVCGTCDKLFTDESCIVEITLEDTVAPVSDHDTIHYEAIEPACHYNGQIEYWYCPACEGFWQDAACTQLTNSKNVIRAATGSDNVTHVEAKAATCDALGNIEYWHCADCNGYWTDSACTIVTNALSVNLPTLDHDLIHYDAIEPSCHYNGNIEYWYCRDCDGFWQDAACTQLTNSKNVILPAKGSDNVTHVEAKDATCSALGNIEYWYCADCDGFWADSACTIVTNALSVNLPTLDHDLIHHEAITPGCHYNGQIEHWSCPDCEGFWQDAECKQLTNSKNVILPATGSDNVTHVEAKAATCSELGNIEYWHCADCEGFWTDSLCTIVTNALSIYLPTLDHNLIHHEAIAPGCHYNGQIEHWSCPDCEGFWQDAECKQLTNSKNVILPATGSNNMVHVEAKAPTCTELGNVEYWHCPDCEGFWLNEACTLLTNSKSVMIGEKGHNVVDVKAVAATTTKTGLTAGTKCSECGVIFEGCEEIAKVAKPNATKIKKAIGGKKKITVKFKKVKGIDGYEIQVALKKNMKKGKKTVIVKASAKKKVIKKLKAGKKYFVRMRTYKVVNGEKVYSKWTAKKRVKTK